MNKLQYSVRLLNKSLVTNQRKNFGLSTTLLKNENKSTSSGSSLINRILRGDQYDGPTNAHSVLLANQNYIYKLQIHDVKPSHIHDYYNIYDDYIPKLLVKYPNYKLVGAWNSQIGILDRYIHLWRYGSYLEYQTMYHTLKNDKEHQEFVSKALKFVNRREHQLCLSFDFWGDVPPRDTRHIYELRSYSLKPGTLIEWSNYWSKGIRTRFDSRVVGLFTQLGPLYTVYHMYAYANLQARKERREKAWNEPGWDECVANTVPLIRKMESKIMVSMPYSPLK